MDDSRVENPETLNGAGGWGERTEREKWTGAMEWEGGKEGRK